MKSDKNIPLIIAILGMVVVAVSALAFVFFALQQPQAVVYEEDGVLEDGALAGEATRATLGVKKIKPSTSVPVCGPGFNVTTVADLGKLSQDNVLRECVKGGNALLISEDTSVITKEDNWFSLGGPEDSLFRFEEDNSDPEWYYYSTSGVVPYYAQHVSLADAYLCKPTNAARQVYSEIGSQNGVCRKSGYTSADVQGNIVCCVR